MGNNLAQKVSGNAKTTITDMNVALDNVKTLSLCNIHATDSVSVDLYITSQVGTDIVDTGTNVNNGSGYAVTTSSQAIVVDATAATSDVFLDEQVFKSDGTLFGTCTAVGSTTAMTFGGGIASAMVDNDSLYTGTRYYILKSAVLPVNTTLVLEQDELRVDSINYLVYIKLSASGSAVDVITRT